MFAAPLPLPARRLQDDVQGLATGTLPAAFGVFLMQQALDALIVPGGGALAGDLRRLAFSALAVLALNLVLVYNHRRRPA